MTTTHKDALREFLFASDGCRLVNLKLMRGDSQEVSVQELRDSVHSVLMEVKTGTSEVSSAFPEEAAGLSIDLEALAASL
ncbi:MAG: hypothetical protein JJ926_11995 [Roseitalea sp.]|jgi:hypothetical protein|nr:hypothetical protein [Roseitalea sp.]MBO6952597.1 hypothetical protein [Rhizobiaceae bacterium]MBO6592916.1 hypothetical protein [Roseitalea sp.]MBO6600341.1 hypothetical protein [Roseitalea sp.]MBO6613247.1 hypothetical protein [Roseitalea sp.]